MMTSAQWYASKRDVEWRQLLASTPIVKEAFEVILRTVMTQRELDPDVNMQALQNAKRDGIFGALQMLEIGLANPPKKKEDGEDPNPLGPKNAFIPRTRRKKEIDNGSTSNSGAAGS